MKKRNILLCIVLCIFTLGIYGIYWLYKVTNETHLAVGRRTSASGGMAILYTFITCGIYGLYWYYRMGESLLEAKEQRHMPGDKNMALVYLILGLFGLGLISNVLIQMTLNDIVDFDAAQPAPSSLAAAETDSAGQDQD